MSGSDPSGSNRRASVMTLGAFAFASMGATFLATHRGPGLSPDSTFYLSSGLNLSRSGRLADFSGVPLTVFPPGLPSLIAMGNTLGLSGDDAARVVCVLSAGLIVVLSHLLIRRYVDTPLALWSATCWVTASPFLLDLTRMVWTEPPFIAVVLGLLLLAPHPDTCQVRWVEVLGAASLCWCAFLLRYAGLALIPAFGATIVWSGRRRPLETAGRAIGFVAPALVVPIGWMLRNHATDGTILGPRSPSMRGAHEVVAQFGHTVVAWLVPFGPIGARNAEAVLLGCGAAVLIVLAIRARRRDDDRTSLAPLTILVAMYSGYIVAVELRNQIDPIDNRLLSPIYVPCVVFVAIGIDRAARRLMPRPRLVVISVAAGLAFFVAADLIPIVRHTRDSFVDGVGLRSRPFQESGLALAVRALPEAALIVTNGEMAMYHLWAVARKEPILEDTSANLDPLVTRIACADSPAYLAWFGSAGDRPSQVGLVSLDLVSENVDGALYRLRISGGYTGTCPG